MRIKKLLFKLVIGLIFCTTYSQTIVKGVITNNENNPLAFVNIILKSENGQLINEYCYSNEKGYYEFTTNKKGKFLLSFSALNYETKLVDIEILEKPVIVEKHAVLIYRPIELQQVIINSEKPISVKKDTITFNAKSFLQGNEKVVEDLLKKIPGLNIASNGTIKIGNQEVEKVMIDGDDFFEKGYKLVTKNMPVAPVEKVELYQNYSNNKHLKGIEKSDKVALNLKLNKKFKNKWFGNTELGYGLGSENRYELRTNSMNFGKNNKYYFITNFNNTSEDVVNDLDNLNSSAQFESKEVIGDNQKVNAFQNQEYDLPNLKQKRVNFNNAEMVSLNSIFTLSSKIKLKILGFFNSDENNFSKKSLQSFSVESKVFENKEDFIGRKNKITGFGKIDLMYEISKSKTFEYSVKFNGTDQKNTSDVNFNGDFIIEKLKSNHQFLDQKVVFTNRFKSNKVLLFTGRNIIDKLPQTYSLNQFLYQDLFLKNVNNITQNSENKIQYLGFEIQLLDRKTTGDLLEIQLGNQLRKDDLISSFQLKNDDIQVNEPVNYQNSFTYVNDDLYLIFKYRSKFNKFNLLTQADFHQLFNKMENYSLTKFQNPFFINPKLGIELIINKKSKLATYYSISKTNVTILDIYPNYIHTGFRSFVKGLGDFNQLNSSTGLLNYSYGSWNDKFFFNSSLIYLKNYDFISTNTFVVQDYTQSQKIIIKNREYIALSTNFDRYIKFITSNFKFSLSGSKSNYKNIVNDSELREVKNTTLTSGFELRSGFKGIFNYHFGSSWNYFQVKTNQSNSFTDNIKFLDLSFMLSKKLNFQIQTERYYFGSLDKLNNKYYFMDFEARYVVKESKFTLSLYGNNLLNTKTFMNYSINDISFSKTEYSLQPRYVLLKVAFRF